MTPSRAFRLVPFPGSLRQPEFDIAGSISRSGGRLAIRYEVTGNLEQIEFAPPDATPQRQDRLWEATCFELFLAIPDVDEYWEFNLSPARHWNVYHFDRYRAGMRQETLLKELPFTTERTDSRFLLSLEAGISPLISDNRPISAGITAVVRMRDGETSFRALAHAGSEPDFHRRDGFIFRLPGREDA